jgi:alginate O-acetyltransferase complex protein AlgI
MLFNSISFFIFLPAVFLLYWFLFQKNNRIQNLFLLLVNYVFYGWWDWQFLLIIAIGSAVNFWAGAKLASDANENHRKAILVTSCVFSLGILCLFKYYNFFLENLISVFNSIGIRQHLQTLNIILPVGISFYTFRMLSYTIDIYRRKLEPTKDIVAFFTFISFFPHLAAGPIDRANSLLPQFFKRRILHYEKAVDGLRQMLWGFFKKIVIADNCAIVVNVIFKDYQKLSGSTLLVGAFYFTIQIYCDFSGYSDIAIGCSRLFGFESMQNFSYPYFSRDISEFWRRWHISLTTWFRDYLYIPLGGNRGKKLRTIRNTFIIFLLCGLWHGANWTFITWGLVNALCFLPLLIFGANRKHLNNVAQGKFLPDIRELAQMTITFVITMFAWIFFRADSIGQAFSYIKHIFSKSLISIPESVNIEMLFPAILLLILVEWVQRNRQHALDLQDFKIPFGTKGVRWLVYYALILLIFYSYGEDHAFIYFKF